jgi:hypothetical protein
MRPSDPEPAFRRRDNARTTIATAMDDLPIPLPRDAIADFCRGRHIRELALFGSVLRDDLGPESDIDVLVTFDPRARFGLLAFVGMEQELAAIFGRRVDLVMREAVEASRDRHRREAILSAAKPIYVAA